MGVACLWEEPGEAPLGRRGGGMFNSFGEVPFLLRFRFPRRRRDRTVPMACQLEEPGTTVALRGEVIS